MVNKFSGFFIPFIMLIITSAAIAQGPWIMEWYALDPVRGTAGIKDGGVTDWIDRLFGKSEAQIAKLGKVPGIAEKGKLVIKGEEGSVNYKNGTYTLKAGGADIWNKADAFRFTYKEMKGDFEIALKAESLEKINDWSKLGPMIRQDNEPGSQYVFMLARGKEGNKYFQERTRAGASATGDGGKLEDAAGFPVWLKIARKGDAFTGSVSADGKTWIDLGTTMFFMRDPVLVGIALTSHTTGKLATGVASNLTISGKEPKFSEMKSEDIGIVETVTEELRWAVRNLKDVNDSHNLSYGIYERKYGDMSNFVFYGIVGVKSPKDQDTALNLAQDDDAKVWINGEMVIESIGWTGGATKTKPFDVHLDKGTNVMMVKVSEGSGGDYLNARFNAEDLEFTTRFSGGMSVSPAGKLAGTWGSIKAR